MYKEDLLQLLQKKKLDSSAALKTVLDKVSTVDGAKAVLQKFLEMLTQKGIDKRELNTALKAMLNPKT